MLINIILYYATIQQKSTIILINNIIMPLYLLSLNDCDDVIEWCKKQISQKKTNTFRRGKNLYISFDDFIITVNASSFTIITAHKKRI